MNTKEIPSEYAIAFLIVVTVLFLVMTVVGTKKLSSDLDQIDFTIKKIESTVQE